jgi:hypothetical protein
MSRFVRCVAILAVVALAGFLSGCTGRTTGATSVTATSATLNGSVSYKTNDAGVIWYQYSADGGASWKDAPHHPYSTGNGKCNGTGPEQGPYSVSPEPVSTLTPGTHYVYRLAVTLCGNGPFTVDSTGTVWGTNYSSFTTAALPAGCSLSGRAVTCTYSSGTSPLTVPQGVSSIHVVAVGGAGDSGGSGARVEADLAVASGATLYAVVGGNGTGRDPGANGGGMGGIPGICVNAPTVPFCSTGLGTGGGGGGASDLRTSRDDPSSRLLVAAGGGGRGADAFDSSGGSVAAGGAGGAGGGANGLDGAGDQCSLAGGGSYSIPGGAGGAGGAAPGAVGSDGGNSGIAGPQPTGCMLVGGGGGGGGGGLHGGAGGDGGPGSGGGGGGGGSNLVPAGGSASVTTAAPLIKITFVLP